MRLLRKSLVIMLILGLIFGQIAMAAPKQEGSGKDDKGQAVKVSDDSMKGTDDSMKGYTWMQEKKVILGNQVVNTTLPPVIKDGRTLIPVRAVTEAMQAKVEWNPTTSVVTITNMAGNIVIKFYLDPKDMGKVTVSENGVTTIVTPDSKSGRINNSTYVPLRFIAETFGLKVDDSKSGISLNPGPVIVPKQVKYFAQADIPEWITVNVVLNGFTFNGIKDLAPANYTYDGLNTVKIAKAYVLTLSAEETKLYFQFQRDGKVELKDFEIELEYKSSTGLEDKPKLNPDKVENPSADVSVSMWLNGYSFSGILYKGTPLVAGTDYILTDAVVVIKSSFISKLSGKDNDLFFYFSKGAITANRKFEIEWKSK